MADVWLASYVLLWAVVIVQTVLLLGALRQLGLIQLRIGSDPGILITAEGIPRGAMAPDFEAQLAASGTTVRRSEFLDRRLLLVFLSPSCVSCKQLIPHLNAIHKEYSKDVDILAVCNGSRRACADFARVFRIGPPVVADLSNGIAASFGINATPFAFLLDADGRVLIRGIANDWTQLERMLEEEGTFQTRPWVEVDEPDAQAVGTRTA